VEVFDSRLGADLVGVLLDWGRRIGCRTIEIVAGAAKSAFADWDFLTREGGFCITSGGFNR
jgi:hypothetical protein